MFPNKFEGQIRVSASRIKSLHKCTYKFYLNEVEKLPETTHPKTIVGSICHSIFECLRHPRGRKYYDIILATGSLEGTPFTRLVKMWQNKFKIDQSLIDDIDSMVIVALKHTNFYNTGATRIFDPEHEFKLELSNGIVKGFIDDLAFFGDVAHIRDYKSQKEKFTKKELESEMQAAVYQLYVWKAFKIPAQVEFVLLRHAPTPRHPSLHLQVVKPKTPQQLAGFEIYLESIASTFKNFGLEEAFADFAADDPKRKYFCEYICQFKNPLMYQSVVKDGVVVKNYLITDDIALNPGESIQIRDYKGCPKFNKF
jgi:RecB family exonuclease